MTIGQSGTSAESAALLHCLTQQREHVLGALAGLTEEQLLRPVLPSGWSCAGLVRHLALDVERFWFRRVMAGEQIQSGEPVEGDAWQVPAGETAAAVLELYRREIALADEVIGATSVDAAPAWWPDFFPPVFHLDSLREVLLHVIAETACHAGHLDAARELTDGSQWMVLG